MGLEVLQEVQSSLSGFGAANNYARKLLGGLNELQLVQSGI